MPIALRPVYSKGASFAHLQVLTSEAKPVSAWSNHDAALIDVVAGIRQALDHFPLLTTPVPRAALPPVWTLPFARNPLFFGRDDLLTRMHTNLYAGRVTALSQTQAISGLGGIGKTQLALEYAYRFHHEYQ